MRALPGGLKQIIVSDCEWRFLSRDPATGMGRSAENHYPTSELLSLMQRDVASIAAPDSLLFMWATAPMLVEAICVAEAWGFCRFDRHPSTGFLLPDKQRSRYITEWAWLKERIATGYWNRGKHEVLLLFTRGQPLAPIMEDPKLPSWLEAEAVAIDWPGRRHSEKPEVFLAWIDQLWPTASKIELNRRGPLRTGWDAWGAEAELPPEDVLVPDNDDLPATVSAQSD